MSALRATNARARRSVKKRIEQSKFHEDLHTTEIEATETVDIDPLNDQQSELFDLVDKTDKNDQNIKPKEGEYWVVKNGNQSLFALIASENPLGVQYFVPSVKGGSHTLNTTVFDVLPEDLDKKISPPEKKYQGRSRLFY